jgi:glucan phosphoethanolaminetransferase (alkaline phosphatase superfamily)
MSFTKPQMAQEVLIHSSQVCVLVALGTLFLIWSLLFHFHIIRKSNKVTNHCNRAAKLQTKIAYSQKKIEQLENAELQNMGSTKQRHGV